MRSSCTRYVLIGLVVSLTAALTWVAPAPSLAADFIKPLGSAPNNLTQSTVIEHLGDNLPLDLPFVDDEGHTVQLRQYFGGKKPVILQLGYYGCPMLCGLISQGLVTALKGVSLNPGPDYEVVYLSIDPQEKPALAAAKKESYLKSFNRPGAASGFHFLTGNADEIARIAQAAGFKYQWVPAANQFSHPAVLIICTPDGRVSRYLYGVKYEPQTVRLSLVEASDGKIGTTVDRFILTCFQYDGKQGRYALAAIGVMKIGGALTILILGGVILLLILRERRRRAADDTI